jgi:drug/metabolite transporter (DMT)-like permease
MWQSLHLGEHVGRHRAAAFYPSIVAFGALFAIGFLGERPEIFHAVGCGLILCGVIVATRAPKAA